MSIPVKCFDSTQTGAPVLSGTAGALIAVLDACLVNGFNLKTLTSLTRSGSLATATVAAGHGYRADDVLVISGANETEYNGEVRIKNVTTTTFQFDVAGTPATPATGTLSAKIAAIGWEKVYSGTNKAAYRSLDMTSTRLFLRVDDGDPRYAHPRGYEAMTDVDTGTGPFPTVAQVANPTWSKSVTTDSTARPWCVVGDGSLFYLFVFWAPAYSGVADAYVFGDFTSYKAGDAYRCLLIASEHATPSNPGHYLNFAGCTNVAQLGHFVARSHTQLPGAEAIRKLGQATTGELGVSGLTYPSPVDNGFHLAPVALLSSASGWPLRGFIPGLFSSLEHLPLSHLEKVTNVDGLPGKTLLAVTGSTTGASPCRVFFDITGPWR